MASSESDQESDIEWGVAAVADSQEYLASEQEERNQMMLQVYEESLCVENPANLYSASIVNVMTVDEVEACVAAPNHDPISMYGRSGVEHIQKAMKQYHKKDAAGKAKSLLGSVKMVAKLVQVNKELGELVEKMAKKDMRRKMALVRMRKQRSKMNLERTRAISMHDAVMKELVGMHPLQKGNPPARTDKKAGAIQRKRGACRRRLFSDTSSSSSMSV